jgi:hypothetical protein
MYVNNIQERKRLQQISYETKQNSNKPDWSKQDTLLRYPPQKAFHFRLREDHDFERPFGLRGVFVKIASAINVITMARRGYLKLLLGVLVSRVCANVYSYTLLVDSITTAKVKLVATVLEQLNVHTTSPCDPASLNYLFTKLLEKTSSLGYLDYFIHNAPHHRIVFGVLVCWSTIIVVQASTGVVVLAGSRIRDWFVYKVLPTALPPILPEVAASTSANNAGNTAGNTTGNTTGNTEALKDLREGEGLEFQIGSGDIGVSTSVNVENQGIPSPGGSPSQTILNTRLQEFEPEVPLVAGFAERVLESTHSLLSNAASLLSSNLQPAQHDELVRKISDSAKSLKDMTACDAAFYTSA